MLFQSALSFNGIDAILLSAQTVWNNVENLKTLLSLLLSKIIYSN